MELLTEKPCALSPLAFIVIDLLTSLTAVPECNCDSGGLTCSLEANMYCCAEEWRQAHMRTWVKLVNPR